MSTENLDEYLDPIAYDLENHRFDPDGPFYRALAHRVGGPILELGAGTGRIAIPLAQEGFAERGEPGADLRGAGSPLGRTPLRRSGSLRDVAI